MESHSQHVVVDTLGRLGTPVTESSTHIVESGPASGVQYSVGDPMMEYARRDVVRCASVSVSHYNSTHIR